MPEHSCATHHSVGAASGLHQNALCFHSVNLGNVAQPITLRPSAALSASLAAPGRKSLCRLGMLCFVLP
jgi:hypothetical protein